MAKSDNGELNLSNVASNNSDPNNSLLQKVTKRVSGLFPSSITKWFGPSDGTPSVIRRRETEDDDEQLQIQQPPKKRAKPTADGEFTASANHFQMTSTPLLNTRHMQPGPSGYTRHAIYDAGGDGPSTRNTENLLNGGDDKSDSGESTSGYSSVLVQQNKEPSFVSDRVHATSQPGTSKDPNTPSPNKSQTPTRSLFSEQSLINPQRQCLSARRPSFNTSTFGSPSFVDRTLSTKKAVNSPFYGGRTIYGGAAAYKRNRIIFPRDEANNIQVKNSVTIKPVNNDSTTNENVSLSKTARRILDTLEHFSTPLIDAKKIPNINRQNNLNVNKRLNPYARENTAKPSAPNRELIIPTVPDLLKMKQKERLQNSTEQVRKLATTSKSILNSEYKIRTLEDESTKPQKHTSKIKAKITTVRDKNKELRDTIDAVQLPDVKLPITNLPKFDFTLPPPQPAPITKVKTPENKKPQNGEQFKFAKPIVVKSDMPAVTSINHFKFSEPIDAKKPLNSKDNTLEFKAECSTAPRKKEQKYNGQNDVGFSLKPPEKLVEGSVMDILGKPEEKEVSLMDKFKPVVGTWECLTCMVRNIPSATRCVACETLKEPPKKPEPKPVNNFGNQFKMSAEKWECSACMVRNNIAEMKCVACTTPKPSKSGSTTVPAVPATTSIFGGFGDKFKPASDTWECGACMIRNKKDAVKCAACETPKKSNETNEKSSLIMKLPETPASSGFTDLIKKQQTNWECPSCMVRNPPEKKTCACCEGPKPGEKQEFKFGTTTQFKFGVDKSATPSNQSAGGSGFSFGPATTFSFGVKPSGNTVDSKPTGFTFGVPVSGKSESHESAVTTATTVLTTATVATTESKVDVVAKPSTTPSFSFGIPIQTSNVVLNGDPKKMFSFGTQSTTITSSTNSTTKPTVIFNPVTTTSSKTVLITNSSESNSAVSSTSTTSITTTTTASSTTFSFGTKPISTPTPQFNFGTGSLPFNPVFGSAPKTTTTFVQPTTNFLNATPQKAEPPQTQTQNPNQTGFNATPTFSFNSATNNNNKTEVKPFSFAQTTPKTETPKGKFPEFTFNSLTPNTTTTTGAPLSKAPVMNFAADVAQKPTNNMFSFGAKTETKTPSFGGGSMFGQQNVQQPNVQQPSVQQQNVQQQNVQQPTPQNGGFNFGATAVTPNFNFGAGAGAGAPASSTTPTVFGFGSSQAGSGSATATAAAASAPGVFTFGGGQPTTAAFTPDIKPNFNFSGGTPIASFTAQGGPSATMPQRKIRKAVRRTQPR